ncbi:hypothetical protein PIIN_09968, partial [Serendipita indica DSM 11827]
LVWLQYALLLWCRMCIIDDTLSDSGKFSKSGNLEWSQRSELCGLCQGRKLSWIKLSGIGCAWRSHLIGKGLSRGWRGLYNRQG